MNDACMMAYCKGKELNAWDAVHISLMVGIPALLVCCFLVALMLLIWKK